MFAIAAPRGARPGPARSDGALERRAPDAPATDPDDSAAADRDEIAIARQHRVFDAHAEEMAELRREATVLREMQLEQMKHDDEIVKKWIMLI